MIRNFVLFFIFPSLIIAFLLSFAGINQVASGDGFRLWMKSVNDTFNSWSFQIPQISKIKLLDEQNQYEAVKSIKRVVTTPVGGLLGNSTIKQRLTAFANFWIMVVNALVAITNVFITIVNIIIQVLQFVLSMVWCVKDIPRYIREYEVNTNSLWWFQNVGV